MQLNTQSGSNPIRWHISRLGGAAGAAASPTTNMLLCSLFVPLRSLTNRGNAPTGRGPALASMGNKRAFLDLALPSCGPREKTKKERTPSPLARASRESDVCILKGVVVESGDPHPIPESVRPTPPRCARAPRALRSDKRGLFPRWNHGPRNPERAPYPVPCTPYPMSLPASPPPPPPSPACPFLRCRMK